MCTVLTEGPQTIEAAGTAADAAPEEPTKTEPEEAKADDSTKAEDASATNGDSKAEKPEEKTRRNGDDRERKPFSRPKHNVKTDFSALAESSDPDEIRKQVRHLTLSSHRASQCIQANTLTRSNSTSQTQT